MPLFLAQIGQESGFNPNARSGAGAVGIAQIVPRWHPGVNATDPNASLKYAANWMAQLIHKYGSPAAALSVYNSGNPNAYRNPAFANGQTYNYVKNILARAGAGTVSPPQNAGPPRQPGSVPQQQAQVQRFKTTNLLPLLKILGLGYLPGIEALATVRTPLPPLPALPQRRIPGQHRMAPPIPGAPLPPNALGKLKGKGTVVVSASANLAGRPIQKPVIDFVRRISQVAGEPITIGTGTNHNKDVFDHGHDTGRVSDHYAGNASDIPAAGSHLTRLGQDALIAAGMPPAQARQQTGGVFNLNVGGYRIQILFNTMTGGNHFNHLHVGVAPR